MHRPAQILIMSTTIHHSVIAMKKIKLRWHSFIFFVFLIIPEILNASPRAIATLETFMGEVMIKNAGSWTSPVKGLRLYSGAKIVTRQGSAIVIFDDGATMQVDAFSSIRAMDQMKPVADSDKQEMIRSIRVMFGRTKYQEQPSRLRQTRIELPTAVAALRGTGGWFGADDQGGSSGSLYEGAMETSGPFAEITPRILTLAQALTSPTWQASVASSGSSGDTVLNVQEIQAELRTFIANLDPVIKKSVEATLAVIETVLEDIGEKYEKVTEARQIKQDSASQLDDVNTLCGEVADTFIAATQESFKADIILILETLKGDFQGLNMARQAKEQNDRALSVAGDALQIAGRAATFVGGTITEIQQRTAVAAVQTASSTLGVVMDTIAISSTSVWLAARDDMPGSEQSRMLMNKAGQILEDAGTAVQSVDDALTGSGAATTDAQAQAAFSLAFSARNRSQMLQIAIQQIQENSQELTVEPEGNGGENQGQPTGNEPEENGGENQGQPTGNEPEENGGENQGQPTGNEPEENGGENQGQPTGNEPEENPPLQENSLEDVECNDAGAASLR